MEIVKATNGVLQHIASHTSHWVTDNSIVAIPVVSVNTGIMYMPIYTEKGPTNVLRTFVGTGSYNDLINTYGSPDVRRLGLPYTMAALHVANGGGLVAQSVKHKSAEFAGFIVAIQIENTEENGNEIKKTLGWVLPDGSGFVEDPDASAKDAVPPSNAHVVHRITTKRISLVSVKVSKINSLDTLVRFANKTLETELTKTVSERVRILPIMYGMYNGEGDYGNNFQFVISDTHDTIEGRPYFKGEFYDTRLNSVVDNSGKAFSISKDYKSGIPLNVNLRFKGDFTVRSIDSYNLDKIGELLYNEFGKVQIFNTSVNTSTEGKLYGANVEDAKNTFGEADKSTTRFNRLSYLNLVTLEQLAPAFVVKKTSVFNFYGGSEGLLSGMRTKGFDWDYTANTAGVGQPEKRERVVANMFKEAFLGQRSAEIYNLWSNSADYILDPGFPDEVKMAAVSYINTRDDIQLVLNAPITISSIDEAIEWKKGNDYYSRLITYMPGNFEYLDTESSESIRVPETFGIMLNLIAHYTERGYAESIAGVDNGMLTLVTPGSGRAIGDLTLKSKDKLSNAGFVYLSAYADEKVFLDSSRANYLLNQRSSLQFFHNNSILNRMMKDVYRVLEPKRHKLNTDESVKRINEDVVLVLKPYLSKVSSINYEGKFKSDYDKAIGLLSHDMAIVFNDEIDYNMVNFIAQR